ncbi:protein of unknown function [Candidatus Nitrosocosmicus franklandus]|uniref:Uncharacterized protein n=1 Tax=Candidatus Nitrosocosmicus franklandianus TaxID=1798806 RepID=A0A484I991_9ARCH|nr:protein of unknown function [Candidatus Nitrosocosmicus franklandus]
MEFIPPYHNNEVGFILKLWKQHLTRHILSGVKNTFSIRDSMKDRNKTIKQIKPYSSDLKG